MKIIKQIFDLFKTNKYDDILKIFERTYGIDCNIKDNNNMYMITRTCGAQARHVCLISRHVFLLSLVSSAPRLVCRGLFVSEGHLMEYDAKSLRYFQKHTRTLTARCGPWQNSCISCLVSLRGIWATWA